MSDADSQLVAWHVAEQLVGWFGVERFEAYRGKEGLQVFGVDELAAVVVAKLGPVWEALPDETIADLATEGRIGQPLVHPWDKTP